MVAARLTLSRLPMVSNDWYPIWTNLLAASFKYIFYPSDDDSSVLIMESTTDSSLISV